MKKYLLKIWILIQKLGLFLDKSYSYLLKKVSLSDSSGNLSITNLGVYGMFYVIIEAKGNVDLAAILALISMLFNYGHKRHENSKAIIVENKLKTEDEKKALVGKIDELSKEMETIRRKNAFSTKGNDRNTGIWNKNGK